MAFVLPYTVRHGLPYRAFPMTCRVKFQTIISSRDEFSISRRVFLSTVSLAAGLAVAGKVRGSINDLRLDTVMEGKGPTPAVGDLVGIRFKGIYNDVIFDDLFSSSVPYFYRVGGGAVLKGIDEAVKQMRVGQVVNLTLPSDLAFGDKGRRASPGKPLIPPNATVRYIVELTTIPGKEDELIEGLDDSEIGSSL